MVVEVVDRTLAAREDTDESSIPETKAPTPLLGFLEDGALFLFLLPPWPSPLGRRINLEPICSLPLLVPQGEQMGAGEAMTVAEAVMKTGAAVGMAMTGVAVAGVRQWHRVSFISTPGNIARLLPMRHATVPCVDLVALPLPCIDGLPDSSKSTNSIPADKHHEMIDGTFSYSSLDHSHRSPGLSRHQVEFSPTSPQSLLE
ncbi:hypothetical protein PR202_gb11717 [Eleusine coracana subsp. coracana]|uniref:Uncharacterized protein n=1 Tax=Eleusine coracana subsp. coracana TaxID=191504 RepID=A0AAV5EKY2_ELECO|nr:hypothetical protein PR202_gb11717 [Eleusine coracana subsp. coracana]